MIQLPKVGDRRPCTERGCDKTQTLVETMVVHPPAGDTDMGSLLARESGPGWICPNGHRELKAPTR